MSLLRLGICRSSDWSGSAVDFVERGFSRFCGHNSADEAKKVWVGDLLARWWVDVATAIHFYEAILATLAILVWHFYQVFFDPDVYPMNWARWDGKMPVEHYRHEHELDAEAAGEEKAE